MTASIRVLLVDDHPIVREGVSTLLSDEADIEVVAEAGSGEAAVRAAETHTPDVVLMDLRLPDFDGIEAARRVRVASERSQIVMLTSSLGEGLRVREAVEAGIVGYLLKDVSREELLGAVRNAAAGRATFHPEAQQDLMQSTAEPPPPHADLTERELDVLRLLGEGLSNKKIAGRLHLTEGTVKGYVSIVLSKLAVDDRTQAALYAVKHRVVDPR